MTNEELRSHMDARFDRLEEKMSGHLERISKAEATIEWLRGNAKLVMILILSALSGLSAITFELLFNVKGK